MCGQASFFGNLARENYFEGKVVKGKRETGRKKERGRDRQKRKGKIRAM